MFRLKKERASKKIDACVALSFAILAAVRHGRAPSTAELLKTYSEPEIDTKFTW